MLRKSALIFLTVMLLAAPAANLFAADAAAPTVDSLIAKNLEARGGLDKMKAVQSMRMTGKMMMGGMEVPLVIEMKRPANSRVEFTFQGMTGVQAYDGKSGWTIAPGGAKDPEPMSAEELKDAEEQSDMDGPLVDYKSKGNKVELVGKEKVEGSDAYKLKITLKNGDIRYLYLDADSSLEIKGESKRTVRGSEAEIETTIGDYKEVEGLLIPFNLQAGAKGSDQKQNIVIEKVELNPTIDVARFKMPAAAKAAAAAAAPATGDAKKPDPKKPPQE
ncbi:MAG TPA: outer membrane lipoprotein-sorting protein [Candidatus Polarisedimenticolia bacterium]|nr:outer membrane lipoprotein-sorting protein [Candidatus Polarisedimenticolia bacterium]